MSSDRDPSKRDIEHGIDELRGSPTPDATESWRRFIGGDLDPDDPNHVTWVTAGRETTREEGREWLREHAEAVKRTLERAESDEPESEAIDE